VTSDTANALRGRVAVVAGDDAAVVPVCRLLLAAGASLAVVAPDRETVRDATTGADDLGITVIAMAADASDAATWDRLVPHAEQRLGPIDIAVVIGGDALRDLAFDRLVTDMARRGHGVFVEAGDNVAVRTTPSGVHYLAIEPGTMTGTAAELASAIVDFATIRPT